MRGIVDERYQGLPKNVSETLVKQYNELVKAWIFCSVSERVLGTVIDLKLAKEVWDKLKSFYDPTISSQLEAGTKAEENVKTDSTISSQPAKAGTKEEENVKTELRKATMKGRWPEVNKILEDHKGLDLEKKAINSDGNTILHLAVGIHDNFLVSRLLHFIKEKGVKGEEGKRGEAGKKGEKGEEGQKGDEGNKGKIGDQIGEEGQRGEEGEKGEEGNKGKIGERGEEGQKGEEGEVGEEGQKGEEGKKGEELGKKGEKEVLELKNVNGSTALHIAAIVGNLGAAKLLVNRHKELLNITNEQGETPLLKACSNMQYDTFMYLYSEANPNGNTETGVKIGVEKGVDLLANAISAKQYKTATMLVNTYPEFAFENDEVLMAIARTFPSGLTNGEKLIYPCWDDMKERIIHRTRSLFMLLTWFFESATLVYDDIRMAILWMLLVPVRMLESVYHLIGFLILMVYVPFFLLYFLSWKVAIILVAPIKQIEKRKKQRDDAKVILTLVCNEIEKSESKPNAHPFNYKRSILEAACQNASPVVDEILFRSPEAIKSTDKSGHDIIQLAIIHRLEKIYNLIHQNVERKRQYRTLNDCSENNILHLASRLAPPHELNRRTGAALQLQRELQWRKEVKELVFPTYITKENIFKETPDMVFTREHEKLVKEGERWMKTTAESCSITAALITTIVFAAAITVPGGSNQDTGIPLLSKDIAFAIFAVSDAISLFTSSTSLLVFLSILTARFAEEDFEVSLPRRLIIGLCTLLLSATAMMVAFSATLFLVFCREKPWMLAPICGLPCLPVAFFFTVQCPLIVDLFRSTYGRIYSKQSSSHNRRFNPDVLGFFGK